MKFFYPKGTKIFTFIVFLWLVLSLIGLTQIKKMSFFIIFLPVLFFIGFIYNLSLIIKNRPIEVSEEDISVYFNQKIIYKCNWDNIKKIIIPFYNQDNDTIIKIITPDKTIKIGTNIERFKKLLLYIKDHVDNNIIIDENNK